MTPLTQHRKQIDGLLAKVGLLDERRQEESQALQEAKDTSQSVEQAQGIVQQVAQTLQQRAHDRINVIVSACLNAVFDEPYQFHLRFDRKRGKTEACMVFIRNGIELDDPLNEVGGGVIDITSLALRIANILLSHPRKRRLIVLDEPFSNVRGWDFTRRTRNMLRLLASDKGFQIIVNTDIPEYRLGTVIEME